MSGVYFGGSAVLGIVGWLTVFAVVVWPRMKGQPRVEQLKTLTTIHLFRYFGTAFLIAGLVSRKLPSGLAYPAAYGDLVSVGLAYVALAGLRRSRAGRPALFPVWLFNIFGAADLLVAMIVGPLLVRDPGDFGLTYIIPTVYVPLLLTAHFYALKVLGRRAGDPPAVPGRAASLTPSTPVGA